MKSAALGLVLSLSIALAAKPASYAQVKNPAPLSAEAKKELTLLQGEWLVKTMGRYGRKIDANDERLKLEIKDVKWIFAGKEKGEFIALDGKASPKCFDLKSTEKGRDGAVDEAIFKIEGDTLTICLYQGKNKIRPTEFETSQESPDNILMIFERMKKK